MITFFLGVVAFVLWGVVSIFAMVAAEEIVSAHRYDLGYPWRMLSICLTACLSATLLVYLGTRIGAEVGK